MWLTIPSFSSPFIVHVLYVIYPPTFSNWIAWCTNFLWYSACFVNSFRLSCVTKSFGRSPSALQGGSKRILSNEFLGNFLICFSPSLPIGASLKIYCNGWLMSKFDEMNKTIEESVILNLPLKCTITSHNEPIKLNSKEFDKWNPSSLPVVHLSSLVLVILRRFHIHFWNNI